MQARKQNKKKEIGRILGWSAGAAVSAVLLMPQKIFLFL